TAADIDMVMTLGMSHPIGPLRLGDLIGLDVCVEIMQVLERARGQAKYAPAKNLQELVRAGRLGRKSGEGVYSYSTEAGAQSGGARPPGNDARRSSDTQ